VAIAGLSALVVAGPASALTTRAAAVPPSGVTDPTPPSSDGSTTSSTSTTTTTKPTRKPSSSTSSTTTTTAPATDPAAAADQIPTAGPPELAKAGVLLPDDSLIAAIQELSLERARVELVTQRRDQLDEAISTHQEKIVKVRALRKHEDQERLDRAVATYRGQSSGWQLGVIVDRSLDQERAAYLVGAVDAATREKIKSFDKAVTTLEAQLKDERAERVKVGGQLDDAVARLNRLLDKLADSTGAISIINGVPTYVPTGPSPIALLADTADTQLSRLIAGSLPRQTDPKWLSASHDLAVQIATSKPGLDAATSAAALEASWAATPPNVLHAMLFALRQVGKAYIYATDGPTTFDCSGLTKAAYAQLNLGLPHFSGAQLHLGVPVTPETLRPGDLLTYGPDGAEHVTMFIGANMDVEAKGRAYGVVVAAIRTDPAKGFAGATRIVP
jgi:cell wall-associated NlpC family hydrolase